MKDNLIIVSGVYMKTETDWARRDSWEVKAPFTRIVRNQTELAELAADRSTVLFTSVLEVVETKEHENPDGIRKAAAENFCLRLEKERLEAELARVKAHHDELAEKMRKMESLP